jgi:hypothetical protein
VVKTAWARVRMSPRHQPDECKICWEKREPACLHQDGTYSCTLCWMSLSHYAENDPYLDHTWVLCVKLLSNLKWRIKQVELEGWCFTVEKESS